MIGQSIFRRNVLENIGGCAAGLLASSGFASKYFLVSCHSSEGRRNWSAAAQGVAGVCLIGNYPSDPYLDSSRGAFWRFLNA